MENNSMSEKEKKGKNDKIFFKNCVYTHFLVFVRLPINMNNTFFDLICLTLTLMGCYRQYRVIDKLIQST